MPPIQFTRELAFAKNAKVIVVAGGPVVRALPLLAEKFFDYSCLGDIEELRAVIADTWGEAYLAEQMRPRFDLAYWIKLVSHVETTRYCNFHCSFCSLKGEGRAYQAYDLENTRQQIVAAAKGRNACRKTFTTELSAWIRSLPAPGSVPSAFLFTVCLSSGLIADCNST